VNQISFVSFRCGLNKVLFNFFI